MEKSSLLLLRFFDAQIKCEQGLEMGQAVQAAHRKNSAYNNPYFLRGCVLQPNETLISSV